MLSSELENTSVPTFQIHFLLVGEILEGERTQCLLKIAIRRCQSFFPFIWKRFKIRNLSNGQLAVIDMPVASGVIQDSRPLMYRLILPTICN